MNQGKAEGFREDEHGTLWFEKRIYVPNDPETRKLILQEAHDSPYSIHPGNTNMYLDLKESFWWTSMKKDIAEYVVACDICQRVKAEHQKQYDYFSPCRYQIGSGTSLAWTSLQDYPGYDSI